MRPEIMEAHRESLREMARMYEADANGEEGMASVSYLLGKAERMIGRILKDPRVPDELPDKEPDTTDIRGD